MGFSNEYLTEEEKELIAKTGHARLTYKGQQGYECLCDTGTVDREKGIWMLKNENDYDYDLKAKGEVFIVFYGNIHKDNWIEINLKDVGHERGTLAKEKYGVNTVQYWTVKQIKVASNINISGMNINEMLEELMNAYGICGDPRHKGPDFDGKFKAMIKERNE